jgi:hypothetical protein
MHFLEPHLLNDQIDRTTGSDEFVHTDIERLCPIHHQSLISRNIALLVHYLDSGGQSKSEKNAELAINYDQDN